MLWKNDRGVTPSHTITETVVTNCLGNTENEPIAKSLSPHQPVLIALADLV